MRQEIGARLRNREVHLLLHRRWAEQTTDVAYATVPTSGRPLLCDLWQPTVGEYRSGVGFIYVHGSAWHLLDNDYGTRLFFRHLVSQGHVVMDMSYRLCPETDVFGMLGDVKRAVYWMKENAGTRSIDRSKVVLSGGLAGGHLALLAAYSPGLPELTPDDLIQADCSVNAVVSYYGPSDLTRWASGSADANPARYSGPCRKPIDRLGDAAWGGLRRLAARGQKVDALNSHRFMDNLVGAGDPSRQLKMANLASPIAYISAKCPPTLIFHGVHDSLVPVEDSRALYKKLTEAGVPTVYVEFPQIEHAFDFFAQSISPPFQNAVYHLDRFIASVS